MVKKYKNFLEEATQNKHLEHAEDLIFHGVAKVKETISFFERMRDSLAGHSKTKLNITTKFDGAPAIVAGYHPENGRFFVATKSLFNKTPKINYTRKDIMDNHPEYLYSKLDLCLRLLPRVFNTKGIYQGDFLFSQDELKIVDIDSEKHVAFRPNTIVYAVPESSVISKTILKAKLGIVFHTKYTGKSIETLSASFSASLKRNFIVSPSVWIPDIQFKNASGNATLTRQETDFVNSQIASANVLYNSINKRVISDISSNEKLLMAIKTYINSKVRTGETVNGSLSYAKDLILFTADRVSNKKDSQATLDYIKDNIEEIRKLFYLAEHFSIIKEVFLEKMNTISSIGTFMKADGGYKVTAPEGFVASDTISGNVLKLVDRLEFSRSNFNAQKDWER